MELITRKEAKAKGLTHYFTGKPCKYGHIAKRFTSAGKCVDCAANERHERKDQLKEYYRNNKERICERVSEYRSNNAGEIKVKKAEYYATNQEEIKKSRKQYRDENNEKTCKQRRASYQRHKESTSNRRKQSYIQNRDKISKDQKEYYRRNREKVIARTKKYTSLNRELVNERNRIYFKKRYTTDSVFKVGVIARSQVGRVLKYTGKKKTIPTFQYLGYTKEQLKVRLESTWTDGMSWDNYGEWHVDHIIPVAVLVRRGITDVREINRLDNLQALWAADNIRKSDHYQ